MASAQIAFFGAVVLISSAAFGQTVNTVSGTSYSLPQPINAAPGQILNLIVEGVGAGLTQRVAAPTLPLPDSVAGISVQLTQTATPHSVAVPLLAVRPVSTCVTGPLTASAVCGHYAVVTVQVPYELVPICQPGNQGCLSATPITNSAQFIVSENGAAGGAVDLNPVLDQIHVANLCDLDTAATASCTAAPVVTHADGSLVSAASPAKVGEEIVIYALGLGAANPAVQTGQAAPSPAAVTTTLAGVEYNYQINAPPSKGLPAPFAACAIGVSCPAAPAFAGLTPGSVGLYQVNVVVPPSQDTFACGAGIVSNLTVTLIGSTSFDGAGICVAASGSATGSAN